MLSWPTRPLLGQTLADLIVERLARQAAGRSCIPVEVIARQIAEAQLSLVDSWVLGRPHMDLDTATDALTRTSRLALTARAVAAMAEAHRFHRQFERDLAAKFGEQQLAAMRLILEDIFAGASADGMAHVRPF
ncbi:hypothetical protein PO883_22930 [Massilia sp. DJPM01]|uniref:hypothetical protein n=1 Tax=Massilia sp. DJPM01 TaxID=3024404 RepID=UPI00259F5740|nr:hypothetical protein [Massilia sp. DJPM01]MDM5180046.1 hypothetical protein [Massilia sp. DJPM01]